MYLFQVLGQATKIKSSAKHLYVDTPTLRLAGLVQGGDFRHATAASDHPFKLNLPQRQAARHGANNVRPAVERRSGIPSLQPR